MTIEELERSVEAAEPPAELSDELRALWYDRKDDWDRAHRIVQEIPTSRAAWVHAYLHRKEGDLGNAGYWYRRAGRQVASSELESEWREIAVALLDDAERG